MPGGSFPRRFPRVSGCSLRSSTSRGNFQKSFGKWLPFLIFVTALPLAAITLLPESVLVPTEQTPVGREFQIGLGGFVLYLCNVICSALILIHLERTFRAAVGTMRWRIKYVILATGRHLCRQSLHRLPGSPLQRLLLPFDIIHTHRSSRRLRSLPRRLFSAPGSFAFRSIPPNRFFSFPRWSSHRCLPPDHWRFFQIVRRLAGARRLRLKAFLLLSSLALIGIHARLRTFPRPTQALGESPFPPPFLRLSRHVAQPHGKDGHRSGSVTSSLAARFGLDFGEPRVLSTSVWLVDPDSRSIRLAASTGSTICKSTFWERLCSILSALQKESGPFDIDKRRRTGSSLLTNAFPIFRRCR